MKSNIIVRQARVEEAHLIKRLAEEVWPVAYGHILSPGQLAYMLELFYSMDSIQGQFLTHNFVLAYLDDQPVGFASYAPQATEGYFKLHKLYVLTETQGSGTGSAILAYVLNTLRSVNGAVLELNVNRHNKAISFYEKQGFKILYKQDVDIGNGYWMNDYVMQLKIHAPLSTSSNEAARM